MGGVVFLCELTNIEYTVIARLKCEKKKQKITEAKNEILKMKPKK